MVTKKNLYNPRCVLDICAKSDVDPTISLGGVRAQTDRQTDKQRTYGYYSIDYNSGSMTADLLPLCQFCGILYGFQLDLTDQSDLAKFSWTGTIFFKNRFYYRMTLHKTSQF